MQNLTTATYDTVMKTRRCKSATAACDSGTGLKGRGTLPTFPETYRPNTLYSTCSDGNSNAGGRTGRVQSLRVSSLNGDKMRIAQEVEVRATVYASTTNAGYESEQVNFYGARNATTPVWTLLGSAKPAQGGTSQLTTRFTLPHGDVQAVRAQYQVGSGTGACQVGEFNDHDDLVFFVRDLMMPSVEISSPTPGSVLSGTVTIRGTAFDNVRVARLEISIASAAPSALVLNGNEWSYVWNTTKLPDGETTVDVRVWDGQGNTNWHTIPYVVRNTDLYYPTVMIKSPVDHQIVSGSLFVFGTASDDSGIDSIYVQMGNRPWVPLSGATAWGHRFDLSTYPDTVQNINVRAVDVVGRMTTISRLVQVENIPSSAWDATLRAPDCREVVDRCSTGGLLVGRGHTIPLEMNAPNTLNSSCSDGFEPTLRFSVERIELYPADSSKIQELQWATIVATVWAGSTTATLPVYVDFYHSASVTSPSWTYLRTSTITNVGYHRLFRSFYVPAGPRQAVRVHVRETPGVPTSCGLTRWDDWDDVIFAPAPSTDDPLGGLVLSGLSDGNGPVAGSSSLSTIADHYSYPNPAKGADTPTVHVETNGSADDVVVQILDAAGNRLVEASMTRISNSANGRAVYEYAWTDARAVSGSYRYVVTVKSGGHEKTAQGDLAILR